MFEHIWQGEQLPVDWHKGLIVKIPKKGDATEYNNWRGIILLSVVSEVFTRIILTIIQLAMDKQLRKGQAGSRKGRACTEQISTLRNIIEQCMEWQASLHLNFIVFEKALDSVHRDTLWKLIGLYGIPQKIISSMINVQGGADADVKTRIGKARQSFTSLKPIWSSKRISLKTNLRLFTPNVKTVLFYGSG